VTVLAAIAAFMPPVFVIIPMVITIIIAFGGFDDAAHSKADEPKYKAAFDDAFCIYHGRS
jgi:hypothetical protein